MKADNKRNFRNDIILIIFLCIIAGTACFFLYFKDNNSSNMQLEIVVAGQVVETFIYETDGNLDKEIVVETGNTVAIKNGQVYMKEADCPDGLCIKQGIISKAGESIICLPHKLVVRLVNVQGDKLSSEDDGLDVKPR